MREEPPARRLQFLLGGDGAVLAVLDRELEMRLLSKQPDDFSDVARAFSSSLGVEAASMVPVS